MTKVLINDATGEVIGKFKDDDILKVYDFMNYKRSVIRNKIFYKFYKDSLVFLKDDKIKPNVLKTLFSFIYLLVFDTNEFVSINGIPSNQKQLAEYLGITERTLRNHVKELENFQVVKRIPKGREVNILVNPYFVSFGSKNTDESLKIFAKSVWAESSAFSKRKNRGGSN